MSCCVSCLVVVLFCLVLPLFLSLFCLICFVLSFCCVALCVCRLGSLCRLIFGRLGSSWGSMLAILGRLGGLLGSFWVVFWASCAVLSGLGAVSRAQYRGLNFWFATWVDFWTVLGAQKGAQTTPRRHPDTPRRPKRWPRRSQRRPKIDDKIDSKNDRFLDPSYGRLGAILGRSWPRLADLKTPQTLRLPMFRENRRFAKSWPQDASWTDLGSIWVAKGGPRRGLWGPKLG